MEPHTIDHASLPGGGRRQRTMDPLSHHGISPHTATADEHPPESPLSIHDMTIAYHRKPVLWDVDLDAPEGRLIGIVGPNGACKSTLLKGVLYPVP